uniref:EGF-like domain-containing protein n=1 Tax=Acrobeloides nanus TaxID=290746 RepID=A0A914E0U6_9BILA
MYFLALALIFVILLPICYASNCTNCGYGYCLKLDPNSACITCACPCNFSGDCCEVQPADGCTPNPCPTATNEHYKCVSYPGGQYQCVCADGYYGANCSEVDCSPYDGTGLYIDNSALNYMTLSNASVQPPLASKLTHNA